MKPKKSIKPPGRREKAELSRQGAKAAARGEQSSANPMEQSANQPVLTGDSPDDWLKRRDAWQAGYDQQAEATQQTRPPAPGGRDDEYD